MRTIALRKMKVWGAAPLDEVLLDTNRYKETVRWTHIAGVLDEGHNRRITLFVRVGGTEIPLKQETPAFAFNSVQVTGDIFLSGNYVIGMRVTGGDVGSEMTITAFGVVEDPVTLTQEARDALYE